MNGRKPVPDPFTVKLDKIRDFQFRVKFDKNQIQDVTMDEGPPLGSESAPDASRMLAAAVGYCLSASLLFCAGKSRVEIEGVHTEVVVQFTRNEEGRLRIGKIDVEILPAMDIAEPERARRCLDLFESYCVVTESVRKGIDVSVSVRP
jgi:organic hydroperoxide reductase OsmC/OhrA